VRTSWLLWVSVNLSTVTVCVCGAGFVGCDPCEVYVVSWCRQQPVSDAGLRQCVNEYHIAYVAAGYYKHLVPRRRVVFALPYATPHTLLCCATIEICLLCKRSSVTWCFLTLPPTFQAVLVVNVHLLRMLRVQCPAGRYLSFGTLGSSPRRARSASSALASRYVR
jgi:hypothetical protein